MTLSSEAQAVKLPPAEWVKLITAVVVPAVGVLIWVGRLDARVDQAQSDIAAQRTSQGNTDTLLLKVIEQTAELRGEIRGQLKGTTP